MWSVSDSFMQVIQAPERKVFAKVEIDYYDPLLEPNMTVMPSENARYSYPTQTIDGVTEPAARYASLDGSTRANGNYHPVPSVSTEAGTYQMGWWGSQLSNVWGYFASPYPKITVSFNARKVKTISVVGDGKRVEYPIEFVIELYADTVLIAVISVTDNTDVYWRFVAAQEYRDITRANLTIKRWSHIGRQVKILEFYVGYVETYDDDDVISVQLTEEREIEQGRLPVGVISANEITVRLYNRDRKFDVDNKDSPLYGLLRPNRRIKAWLGVQINDPSGDTTREYVPLGAFWSIDWDAPSASMYVEVTGRDRMELLGDSTYSTSVLREQVSLYDLAVDVLNDAGLGVVDFSLDPRLQSTIVPIAYFKPMSHREALRLIAEAGLCQAYFGRDGRLYVVSSVLTNRSADLAIAPNQYFRKSDPVNWGGLANSIEVTTRPLVMSQTSEEVYNSDIELTQSDITVTANYSKVPCTDAVAQVTSGYTITGATYYSWGAVITVSGPPGTFNLRITARPAVPGSAESVTVEDQESIRNNGLVTFVFPENHLVQTRAIAQDIANVLLAGYKNPQRDIVLDWRGNPALLLGDVVRVGNRNYLVYRQDIEYHGYLKATLDGRYVGDMPPE